LLHVGEQLVREKLQLRLVRYAEVFDFGAGKSLEFDLTVHALNLVITELDSCKAFRKGMMLFVVIDDSRYGSVCTVTQKQVISVFGITGIYDPILGQEPISDGALCSRLPPNAGKDLRQLPHNTLGEVDLHLQGLQIHPQRTVGKHPIRPINIRIRRSLEGIHHDRHTLVAVDEWHEEVVQEVGGVFGGQVAQDVFQHARELDLRWGVDARLLEEIHEMDDRLFLDRFQQGFLVAGVAKGFED
jgi:hypothetical protein